MHSTDNRLSLSDKDSKATTAKNQIGFSQLITLCFFLLIAIPVFVMDWAINEVMLEWLISAMTVFGLLLFLKMLSAQKKHL